MDRRAYNKELDKAESELKKGKDIKYWDFYIKGLKRQFYGSKRISDEEHEKLLKLSNKNGIGYQDGFTYRPSIGRTPFGDLKLAPIRLTTKKKEEIQAASMQYPSEADWVREAIDEKLNRHLIGDPIVPSVQVSEELMKRITKAIRKYESISDWLIEAIIEKLDRNGF